jgi:hypothetical protein
MKLDVAKLHARASNYRHYPLSKGPHVTGNARSRLRTSSCLHLPLWGPLAVVMALILDSTKSTVDGTGAHRWEEQEHGVENSNRVKRNMVHMGHKHSPARAQQAGNYFLLSFAALGPLSRGDSPHLREHYGHCQWWQRHQHALPRLAPCRHVPEIPQLHKQLRKPLGCDPCRHLLIQASID